MEGAHPMEGAHSMEEAHTGENIGHGKPLSGLRILLGLYALVLAIGLIVQGGAEFRAALTALEESNSGSAPFLLEISTLFLALQAVMGLLPSAAKIALLLMMSVFLHHYAAAPFGPAACRAMERLRIASGRLLAVVLVANVGFNVLQLAFSRFLLSVHHLRPAPGQRRHPGRRAHPSFGNHRHTGHPDIEHPVSGKQAAERRQRYVHLNRRRGGVSRFSPRDAPFKASLHGTQKENGRMAIRIYLDEILRERHMTSKELCRLVGITEANLSILRSGKAKGVRFGTVNRICYYLQCDVGDILKFDGKLEEEPEHET